MPCVQHLYIRMLRMSPAERFNDATDLLAVIRVHRPGPHAELHDDITPRSINRTNQKFPGPLIIALLMLEHRQLVDGRTVSRQDGKHLFIGFSGLRRKTVRMVDTPQSSSNR